MPTLPGALGPAGAQLAPPGGLPPGLLLPPPGPPPPGGGFPPPGGGLGLSPQFNLPLQNLLMAQAQGQGAQVAHQSLPLGLGGPPPLPGPGGGFGVGAAGGPGMPPPQGFGAAGGGLPPGLLPHQAQQLMAAVAAQQAAQQDAASSNSNPTLAALLGGPPQDGAAPGAAEAALAQHGVLPPGPALERPEEGGGAGGMPRRRDPKQQKLDEEKKRQEEAEKVKCHLHKKPKAGCRFCKKYQDFVADSQQVEKAPNAGGSDGRRRGRRPDRAISEDPDADRRGPLELVNPTKGFGFSGLLQTHITECAHYKSLLSLETFDQLVEEMYQFANGVEPYMVNSGTLPSALFCCLYRFFTMALDGRNLRRLIDNQESAYIRCAGFLYVRMGLPHDQMLDWLGEYLLDDDEFQPTQESDWKISIGDYVEGLLRDDKYYNTVLPRLPMVTRRHVEEKLAPLGQNRKRMKVNKDIIDTFRESGMKIETCIGCEWLHGTLLDLEDEAPSRPKVRVRLEDGSEEYVHLGKVIIADSRVRVVRRAGRSRSRSRGGTDWTRHKGRSDHELLDEMRCREREKAVCSSGKDYARKPVGYKAACALPREQGAASYKLMEEETFVPMNRGPRRHEPSPEREHQNFGRRPSAEHQARMQQLFEKYGNVKGLGEERRTGDDVDRPDVMRLG